MYSRILIRTCSLILIRIDAYIIIHRAYRNLCFILFHDYYVLLILSNRNFIMHVFTSCVHDAVIVTLYHDLLLS